MGSSGSNKSKGEILVVDDTLIDVQILSTMLSEKGYSVITANSGAESLEKIGISLPDLILLDIDMPGMSGYDVCEKLKEEKRSKDIPIMFVSALDDVMDRVKAFTMGGVDYLTKPFAMEELLVRVENHLTMHRLQEELRRNNDVLEERVKERTAELAASSSAYERFVPREFLSFLEKRQITEVRLADQVQEDMTIMFSDIRDFTPLSESISPQETFNLLNSYLERVSPVILEHNGFIDQYVGDGIMALFPSSADDAVRATVAMMRELEIYNTHRQRVNYSPIRIGIGLHTGSLTLGIIGGAQRMQGTVIADAVNLASRLENLTKRYGAPVIVSQETLEQLSDRRQYHIRTLDRVKVKGKSTAVTLYEILDGEPEERMMKKLRTLPLFDEGLTLYYDREFCSAQASFSEARLRDPEDRALELFETRSQRLAESGVCEGWCGVEELNDM
jgi:class 3 adenylate cyclase